MSYVERFKSFVSESRRVLRVTKKPTKDEYLTISKVSAIGILIIGFIGFLLYMIDQLTSLAIVTVIVAVLVIALLYIKKQS